MKITPAKWLICLVAIILVAAGGLFCSCRGAQSSVAPGNLILPTAIAPSSATATNTPLNGTVSLTPSTTASAPVISSPGAIPTLSPSSSPQASPSVVSVVPPEVTQFAKDWPLPNKDYSSRRATKDSSINSSNISSLKPAWAATLGNYPLDIDTNPIIMGNDIYIQDVGFNLFKLDFNTGKVVWQAQKPAPSGENSIGQSPYSLPSWSGPNGVAVGWGKVFGTSNGSNLVATDPGNGKVLYSQTLSALAVYTAMQPIPYDGLVYYSTMPDPSTGIPTYGYQWAFNQNTGLSKWAFLGVDSFAVWGHPELNGGGGSYMSPSIDTGTGISYWGTRSPYSLVGPNSPYKGPAQFKNGSSRPGADLYTNSILALDHATGKLVWYQQPFPHDLFLHDFQNSPVLAAAQINGQNKDIVIGSGKGGIVYAYDRKDGRQYWSTQIGKHQNDTLTELPDAGIEVFPGLFGGIASPIAVADGMVFVPYIDLGTNYNSLGQTSLNDLNTAKGGLAALDINTGKVVWDNKFEDMNFGGATVVNDLVITGTYHGKIMAFNTRTGNQVYSYQASAGIKGTPSISRDTIIFPCGTNGWQTVVALRISG